MRIYQHMVMALIPTIIVQSAQAQPSKPMADGAKPQPSAIQKCEEKLKSLHSLTARVRRTTDDKVFRVHEVYEGELRMLRPDMVMIDMAVKDKALARDKFIKAGNVMYMYCFGEKSVWRYSPSKQRAASTGIAWLDQWMQSLSDSLSLFPIPLDWDDFHRHYTVRQTRADDSYVYVELIPKSQAGKSYFVKARLVFRKDNYLPSEWLFEQPNGNTVRSEFLSITENPPLNAKDFTAPTIPPGWTLRKEPKSD